MKGSHRSRDRQILSSVPLTPRVPPIDGPDAVEDLTFLFQFKTETANAKTFLYNTGPISVGDLKARNPYAGLNVYRLGLLAGQNYGFPNGRRLGDDVVDIALRVVAGVLDKTYNVSPNNELGDTVVKNDKPFLASFPYLAPPPQDGVNFS